MGEQIMVTLPEDVLQRAELWARRTRRPVNDFIAETIELSLRPLGMPAAAERPLTAWSDEEVLAAADGAMPAADNRLLRELLDLQQARHLSDSQRAELTALMQAYQ